MDIDNEIIAGSEDEFEMPLGGAAAADPDVSHISAFTTSMTGPATFKGVSSISNFTNSTHTRPANPLPQDDPIRSSFGLATDDGFPVASIADRAKTRQRKATSSTPIGEVLELTSDEDDFIPNRASKPKPKPKAKTKPKPSGTESAGPSSDSRPLNSTASKSDEPVVPKSRPRPRPLKKPRPALIPIPAFPPINSTIGADVPVASSSPPQPIPPAQTDLPPSDPPLTSSFTHTNHDPLFSDEEDVTVGRKRPSAELESPPAKRSRASPQYFPPPPSTFFASSSVPPEPVDVVDLTDLLLTQPPLTIVLKPTKKAKRKLTGIDIHEEDDLDDAFDPSSSKKKGKAKAKTKTPKGKSKEQQQPAGAARVEVAITSKPKAPKAPSKGKGKQKDAADDTFKSREFIEDSDDDSDPLLLRPSDPKHHPTEPLRLQSPQPSPPKLDSTASNRPSHPPSPCPSPQTNENKSDTTTEQPDSAPAGRKSKPKGKKRKSIIDSDAEPNDAELPQAPDRENLAKKKKASKKDRGKDGGNLPRAGDDEMPEHDSASAKVSGSTKKSKGNVIMSDGDGEGDEDVGSSRQLTGRKSKSTPKAATNPDEDDDMDVDEEEGNSNRKNDVDEAVKENVMPSKKAAAPSATPTKPVDTKGPNTPLYLRYEVAPRRSSLPMSELIRRASTPASTPLATAPRSRVASTPSAPTAPKLTPTPRTYSPYLKSSRSALSRIAPLHANRKTPPPPPPPPPPRKKTKKELELEEQWEEELIESVGGPSEWTILSDAERKELRKMKWAKEMGNWSD